MELRRARRDFLRTGIVTTAALLTGASPLSLFDREALAGDYPDVAIAHGNDPATMTRSAVNAVGGIKRFVKPGNRVVIKPNMSFAAKPGQGANTNPAVVAEVARLCHEAGASGVSVLDNVLSSAQDCLSMSRIPEYCEKVPNTVVANVYSRRMFGEVKVPNGRELSSMRVMKAVLDADVLIAVPVGKSHSGTGVSLSMKGMMGLIYDRGPFHKRYDLHGAIVDMASVLKPHLVVIDGTRILSAGGPGGPGKVIPLNLVIASADMVAADAQMVALGTWYGRKFRPDQVRHIRIASERGLGRSDLKNLKIQNVSA